MLHLTFSDPLNLAQLSAFLLEEGVRQLRDPRNRFRADVARLARVGYASRFLDAIFSLTLFLRGRVPGDSAAAAMHRLPARRPEAERIYPYYGRVVRENGWIVLQYWIFYPFNNWRSGFFGANDHEADWEMIAIYLYERADGEVAPAWVAYASHDFHGDDLRRAWDDAEELERVGEHPVVYVGAGSHAAYFRRGEYVTEIEVPYLHRLARADPAAGRLLAPDAAPGRPGRRRAAPRAVQDPVRGLRAGRRHRHRPGPPARLVAGPDRSRARPGSRGSGGSGATSRATRRPARTRHRARCTTATAPSAAPGTTRSAGPAWTTCRRPAARSAWSGAPSTISNGASRSSTRPSRTTPASSKRSAPRSRPFAASTTCTARLTSLEARVQAARAEAYARRRERAQNEVLLEALAGRLARLQQRDPDAVTLAGGAAGAHPAAGAARLGVRPAPAGGPGGLGRHQHRPAAGRDGGAGGDGAASTCSTAHWRWSARWWWWRPSSSAAWPGWSRPWRSAWRSCRSACWSTTCSGRSW